VERLSRADRERVREDELIVGYYADGWSIRKICREVNRSYGHVHKRLTANGVTFRPRGGDQVTPDVNKHWTT
jgi:hypothetical protein